MTNTKNSEKIVVSSKVVNNVAVLVEAEDLYLPPMVRVKNKDGENLLEFPMEYLNLISGNAHSLIIGLSQQQTILKKTRGNPDGRYDFLEISDKSGNEFIVKGTNIEQEGTPYLKWSPDIQEDTRRNVEAKEDRVEKATCHIGSVVLGSTNKKGAATFHLNLNDACKVSGKWVAMTTQYHYLKGYMGIKETTPNISIINNSLTITNLGDNGYEQKIVQILFFLNTKQVASEKEITYWL